MVNALSPVLFASNNSKKTKAAYNIPNIGFQTNLPVGERRDLSAQEQKELDAGLSGFWPKIMPGYNTKLPQMVADPVKVGAITGTGAAVTVGTIATLIGSKAAVMGEPITATIGAVVTGLAAIAGFVGGFFSQRNQNENVQDMMHRLPEGATYRDMLSDNVYNQSQVSSAGSNLTNPLLAGMIAGSIASNDNK